MAAGCAIVASDLPAVREILAEDEAVWIRPGDPHSLAAGLRRLVADPDLARALSARVRAKARQYTWARRAVDLTRVLQTMASASLPDSQALKILVIRRDNIGDLVCTTPLISALRLRYPRAHIAALVNTYNRQVLEGHPDLDAVYAYAKAKHRLPGAERGGHLLGQVCADDETARAAFRLCAACLA